MGAEHENGNLGPPKGATEPGLGPTSDRAPATERAEPPSAAGADGGDDAGLVDFAALNAALGDDPFAPMSLPPPEPEPGQPAQRISQPQIVMPKAPSSNPVPVATAAQAQGAQAAHAQPAHAAAPETMANAVPAGVAPAPKEHAPNPQRAVSAESQGRSSATYASAPRAVPKSRATNEPSDMPAIIVASEETVPTGAPQMTSPMAPPVGAQQTAPLGAQPMAPLPIQQTQQMIAPVPGIHPGSGPHAVPNAPGSGPNLGQPPFTPPQFQAAPQAGAPQQPRPPTMRMPDRPRRAKNMTVVVRQRGPSVRQRLAAFITMLLLVTACGVAVIIWRKPQWLGLADAPPQPDPSASAAPSAGAATGAPPPTTSVAPPPSAASSAPTPATSASASAAPTTTGKRRHKP